MPERELVQLRNGAMKLDLCPELGGAITRFRYRDHDVMRSSPPAFFEHASMLLAASFPLVPFSGRIADGRFRFRGQVFQLAPNFPPEPHAIHGQGWQHPWRIAETSESRAVLTFAHAVPDTPLSYRARQEFELQKDGLLVAIELTNAGTGPMPAGIGLHPYFIRTAGVTLTTRLAQVWLADERNIPKARVPLPPAWDFAKGPRVAALEMDNGFDGWNGRAEIRWPETDLTLAIEAEPVFGHLVIYIPPGADFFCVEPVSHANDGFNLLDRGVEGTGVRVLDPGASLCGRVGFRIS